MSPAGRVLALGAKGDAARQRGEKAPVVERGQHLVDGQGTAHRLAKAASYAAPSRRRTHGEWPLSVALLTVGRWGLNVGRWPEEKSDRVRFREDQSAVSCSTASQGS
jgi:hypothetical protein